MARSNTFSQYDEILSSRESEPLLSAPRGRSITFSENAANALHEASTTEKLSTYDGVFVPTTLNVLSILMFLRFGFIIGQAGFAGSTLLLVVSYAIGLLTILSISAIATNGTVRGGGAYYMISRSLGPEFGGSIGIIFYIGQVLNAALNVVGFALPLVSNFGVSEGAIARLLPDSPIWLFVYETLLLWICLVICVVGPSLFTRSSKLLFFLLIGATLSLPVSVLFVKPYFSVDFDAWYTGPSWHTFHKNFWPQFTKGAAGSDVKGRETFRDLFSIFFPATAGVFAGASMSGDLKKPSRSIPKGSLWGLLLTFVLYFLVIVSIACSCSRELLYRDVEVMRDSNLSPLIIIVGEFSTSLFSAMMGILGAAKLLQAISRDNIVPWIARFGEGTEKEDNPIAAIVFTYIIAQVTILLPINQIATFITMAFLLTFVVTNVACLLLRLSAAPNFRPSFRYFSSSTASAGLLLSLAAMFVADGTSAGSVLAVTILLFAGIHYYTPPKPWGDVSQGLIYHQVRKYLLKLRLDHVKYWRPQILLLVDDPRTSWSLIKFCSHLKKGGLFILGHVVVVKDFSADYPEVEKQGNAWRRLRDMCQLKAFVQVSACATLTSGVRNIVLGNGLGGMKCNITVLGFYDESSEPSSMGIEMEALPTDACRNEQHCSILEWTHIIEDLLTMKSTVAVARGFNNLEYPTMALSRESKLSEEKGFIDLYPIQMSAVLLDQEGKANGYSINFDTYTLILQLGAILHTVPVWKKTHNLRVVAFVERAQEVPKETERIRQLLEKLRIPAAVLVVPLNENNHAYQVIVEGKKDTEDSAVERVLGELKWWQKLKELRTSGKTTRTKVVNISRANNANQVSRYVLPDGGSSIRKRRTLSQLEQMGVSHSLNVSSLLRPNDLSTFYDSEETDISDEEFSPTLTRRSRRNTAQRSTPMGTPSAYTYSHTPMGTPGALAHSHTPIGTTPSSVRTPAPAPLPSSSDDAPETSAPKTPAVHYADEPTMACTGGDSLMFNDLPGKAQHLILNELMRKQSQNTVVMFTTLPAPAFGTHLSEERSNEYYDLLCTFSDGLPPCVLIHSQSMTVTTAL